MPRVPMTEVVSATLHACGVEMRFYVGVDERLFTPEGRLYAAAATYEAAASLLPRLALRDRDEDVQTFTEAARACAAARQARAEGPERAEQCLLQAVVNVAACSAVVLMREAQAARRRGILRPPSFGSDPGAGLAGPREP